MFKPVMQDVNFGLRMLRKSPGFTIVAVLTLALGIGANTAVFTLVNAVLFKGLPYEDSDRILMISSNNLAKNQPQLPVSYPDFLDLRAQSKAFKDLAAAQPTSTNISDPDMPAAQYSSGRISTNTFSLLGQKPLIGRDFLPEEDQGAVPRLPSWEPVSGRIAMVVIPTLWGERSDSMSSRLPWSASCRRA